MSLGSGDRNWKTAPPLASGHLNERSAPGDTGSPCSIFRKDSRNPEDREDKRGKDRQDTQRERKRGLLKRWSQARDSTSRLLSRGYGAWKRRPGSAHVPSSSQHPDFKAHRQLSSTRENRENPSKAWERTPAPNIQDPPPQDPKD